MAGVIKVDCETFSQTVRTTRAGKQLRYQLEVLQQPERARACGAGAKSSADRRPVDPPPVVELRVFEDDRDVTFSYNANFFLFATLEAARTQATPRGQPVTVPVLTGVPVAGMAYLDRPKQAGYFIFPDLSVRHEGNYRLSFNLFEEIKEQKDDDAIPNQSVPPGETPLMSQTSTMSGPTSFLHYRLVVKSLPFQVYSAKKFPGLAESTQLSRMVAEQGCRVRIRRDVRMRRRDQNGKDEFYDEEEGAYSRAEHHASPDNYPQPPMSERARSASRGSVDVPHGYGDISRRTSMTDMGHQYHTGYHTPQATATAPPLMPGFATHSQGQSHLSFGHPSTPQYAMGHPNALPPVMPNSGPHWQQSPHFRHLSSSYQSPAQSVPNPQSRSHTPSGYPVPELSQGYNGAVYHENVAGQRPYASFTLQPMPQPTPGRGQQELPPIAALQSQVDEERGQTPTLYTPYPETTNSRLDGLGNPMPRPAKRTHDDVFYTSQNQPLHHGMRPDSSAHSSESADYGALEPYSNFEYSDPVEAGMVYKRADGKHSSKPMPEASPRQTSSLYQAY